MQNTKTFAIKRRLTSTTIMINKNIIKVNALTEEINYLSVFLFTKRKKYDIILLLRTQQ